MRGLAALLVAAWLVVGCGGLSSQRGPQASEEERRAYAQAVSSLVDDPARAETELKAFLDSYPQSPLADDAGMRLGELALQRGDQDTALRRFYQVVRIHPEGDRTDATRVEIARIELARGKPEAAESVMRRARLSQLSSTERRAAYRVMVDVSDDPVEKLRWLARVRSAETDADEVALVDVEIDQLITQMDFEDLMRAAEQIGREIPAARVLLKAGERALDAGVPELARDAVDRASRLPLAPPYQARLTLVSERLRLREQGGSDDDMPGFAELAASRPPSTAGAIGTIGVVLPLSGRFAAFGEDSLQGVLLAAGVFGADPAGRSVKVLIRDTAGRPERAADAVRELAALEVSAIVGPLLRAECEAAAVAAEEAGVPLVALTARSEVSTGRANVFRVRTMPREEVDTLVRHAIHDLGAQRFAILYPRDAYGRGLRRLFWSAVEEQGGRVVGVAAYEPDATDFGTPIRSLVGYTLLGAAEKQAIKEREDLLRRARRLPVEEGKLLREEAAAITGPGAEPLPPIVDFDALFVPESHEKMALIAPQLAFHEAVGTQLLGPHGWNHPDLVRIGREHVEGARFTAHFHADSPLPWVRDFTRGFESAYAEPPDVFAAQAFDAANLVLVQLAGRRDSRDDVREGILRVRGYPGVTGVLTMGSDGNARKRPFLIAVENGKLTQVMD